MLQQLTLSNTFRAERTISDGPVGSNHIAASTIGVIRRDQMPGDIRSAFLPEDTIIFCVRRRNISPVSRINLQNHRKRVLVNLKCGWCKADGVCAGVIMTFAALIWLGAYAVQSKDIFTFFSSRHFISALMVLAILLTMGCTYTQFVAWGYGGVNPRCSHCVKFHFVRGVTSRILSRSSQILLQRPMVNARSFFRFYKLFTEGHTGGSVDEEVDSCIRELAAEGSLTLAALTEDGSQALLGVKPCQDIFTRFGWGLSWLNVLYQSYRDWKRWRLATMMCERLWAGDSGLLQHGCLDGHNHLARLGDRGGHKWFLVDPELFIPRIPSRQLKA